MEYITDNIDSVIVIVLCILIGIVIAFIYSLITRGIYGKFIDSLVKQNAESEENAKTFSELGINKNFVLSVMMKHKTTLSSLVTCVKSDNAEDDCRYYLKPENQIKALGLYGRDKMTPVSVIVAILLIIVVALFFQYAIPKILN